MATEEPQTLPEVAEVPVDAPRAVESEKRISAPLTPSQIAIVKSTAPILKVHGEAITTLMYKNMLAAHPELNNIFNLTSQASGEQPRALAASVLGYATYVDDLGKLSAVVERIAQKHVSLTVEPAHYAIVGRFLIEAVATVLGDAVTPEVAEAWTAAYAALADIFINREKTLYAAFENWAGWRRFKIQRKVAESAEITSFYLAPEDGQPLPTFRPGQYISVRLFVPELGHYQPRQYSLSDAPQPGYYRISVKKDAGKDEGLPGIISNMLHDNFKEGDVVELTHPAGDFFLADAHDNETTAPVVLISAGVGLTPMVSMLNSLVAAGSQRPVSWIHGAHSSEVHAFGPHIRATSAAADDGRIQATVFKTEVDAASDVHGVDYHFGGRIDLAKLDRQNTLFLDDPTAHYYICGPTYFMWQMRDALVEGGADLERVHLEVFGTGDGL